MFLKYITTLFYTVVPVILVLVLTKLSSSRLVTVTTITTPHPVTKTEFYS